MTATSISIPTRASNPQRALPWLLVLFFGSGCAALIYEVVWLQLLQLVLGLNSLALGILLAVYMGGMCLGSLLLPHWVGPHRHPLRVYALLEAGIGTAGLLIPVAVPWISNYYTQSVGHGLSDIVLRALAAALCLLPPTMCMGATLPAMARWVRMSPEGVSWLGFFYGGNLAGAVLGCLLAGFYLLRVHDVMMATWVAASLNALVATLGLYLASRNPTAGQSEVLPAREPITRGNALVYLAIAGSGLTALGAEVVWTRLLSLLLGGTVYTFSIILAVFLVGLGIGSGLGSIISRRAVAPRLVLALCQLSLCAATAWAAYVINQSLPYWPVNPSLSKSPWITFQLDMVRCLWPIFPAACLWGASFPLALAASASPGQDSGKLVGRVYAANTVGAILGALVFSLVLVPTIGTQGAQRCLVGFSAAFAALLLPFLWQCSSASTGGDASMGQVSRPVILVLILASIALPIWLIRGITPPPWGVVAFGRQMATWEERIAPKLVTEWEVPYDDCLPDIFCTYMGEGLNGSVAVTEWNSGIRSFHSAGKVQASSDMRDMRLQRMLGHLSALVHAKPESVLVVACGAGVTAGSFVVHPEVKRIVICDIEPLVPKFVAPKFAVENYNVVKDPRTQVVIDDGRHFIRTTREKFDIITSDPIDPWVKGCAALNTIEYYQMCKDHLKPGGVMSLWMPLYESNPEASKSLIATFFKVFPNGIIWSNDDNREGYDAVLLGQADPAPLDVDRLHDRLSRQDHERVRQSLDEVGFRSLVSLFATFAGQASDMSEWTKDAQINTDRNLRLQYLAGLWLNANEASKTLNEILKCRKFPDQLFTGSESRLKMLKLAFDPNAKTK